MKHDALRYAHDEGHTDVCYASDDGKKFITCGSDGDIRIWSPDESDDPAHSCIGEWARCVRHHGDRLYVATGSNDIQILTLSGDRDGVLDRFTAPINHIAVSGQLIALAAEEMQVKLVRINDSRMKETLTIEGLNGPCLSVAVSSDSRYVAAGCGDTKLRVWRTEDLKLVKECEAFPKTNSFSNAKVLCRMDFDPSGKKLAYPYEDSVVVLQTSDWSQHSILSCEEVSSYYSIVQFSPCGLYLAATSEDGDFVVFDVGTEEVSNLSKHPKDVAISAFMWNPSNNGTIVYTDAEGQLGVVTECIIKTPAVARVVDTEVDFGDVEFEDEDDEENVISVEKLKKQVMGEANMDDMMDAASSRAPTPRPRTPEVELQAAFMPSSTPEHLDPRYLCWNAVGVVRCYGSNAEDEGANKSIEVEFHDSTFHSSMMVQNYQEYSMGSISVGALVVANSSQLNVIPLGSGSKDWHLRVDEAEEIVLVASSEHLVCLGLSSHIVRVCTVYGTPRGIVSIPGPLVSMAAYKNLLLVAYHCAGVRNGDQCIGIKLLKFDGLSVDGRDLGSALGPGSTLQWLGFSEAGTPAMMDSLGMLCMHPHACNVWIPFCDTTKHRKCLSDGFFVTSISETYQAVGGIKCKGSAYPGFTPRPTMCELPLEPPYADFASERTQMEGQLFVYANLRVADAEKKYKEAALKTFALACKNNLDERAYELVEMINNPQIVALGTKYATRMDKRRLAEKLMKLSQSLLSECDDLSETVSTPEPATLRPQVNRKLKLSSSSSSSSKYGAKARQTKQQQQQNNEESQDLFQNTADAVLTPNHTHNLSLDSTTSTQETSSEASEPKNPFLKSMKKPDRPATPNPLSLTDAHAGVVFEKENNKTNKTTAGGEKRKQLSDSSSDTERTPTQKQRKLDMFKFHKK